jgi:hypothetical protein
MVNGFYIGTKNLNYRGLRATWTAVNASGHYVTALHSLRTDSYSPKTGTRVCGYHLIEYLKPKL